MNIGAYAGKATTSEEAALTATRSDCTLWLKPVYMAEVSTFFYSVVQLRRAVIHQDCNLSRFFGHFGSAIVSRGGAKMNWRPPQFRSDSNAIPDSFAELNAIRSSTLDAARSNSALSRQSDLGWHHARLSIDISRSPRLVFGLQPLFQYEIQQNACNDCKLEHLGCSLPCIRRPRASSGLVILDLLDSNCPPGLALFLSAHCAKLREIACPPREHFGGYHTVYRSPGVGNWRQHGTERIEPQLSAAVSSLWKTKLFQPRNPHSRPGRIRIHALRSSNGLMSR